MIISIDAGKAFDKIQHPLIIKKKLMYNSILKGSYTMSKWDLFLGYKDVEIYANQ